MRWLLSFVFIGLGLFSPVSRADLSNWLKKEVETAQSAMLANVSPVGLKIFNHDPVKGFVIASPSPDKPDYYFNWIRDSALVSQALVSMYLKNPQLESRLWDYFEFSKANQAKSITNVGLGEVKFNFEGNPEVNWMRPQNDGPALRAITLLRFAQELLKTKPELSQKIYAEVVKVDLIFVATHWSDTCYELWEEDFGHHFYTQMVQRKALLEGIKFLEATAKPGEMPNPDLPVFKQSRADLETQINNHWIPKGVTVTTPGRTARVSNGQIWDTFDRNQNASHVPYKASGYDSSIVLAALHGDNGDNFFTATNDKVLKTAMDLSDQFSNLYSINVNQHFDEDQEPIAPAIGRYPEDKYNGYGNVENGGNPWILTTLAYAELYYRAAKRWRTLGAIAVTDINVGFFRRLSTGKFEVGSTLTPQDPQFESLLSSLHHLGDRYLRRVKYHTGPDGRLSEEIFRNNGFTRLGYGGAQDLSWSYAALLTVAENRP